MATLAALCLSILQTGWSGSFINFETAPLHPVALNSNGSLLAVCNLPDGRVEIFDLASGFPKAVGSVLTGIDPVTAKFAANGELWVVNQISDSITIVDPSRRVITGILPCFDAPADVVFTKSGEAYVSHAGERQIKIFNINSREESGSLNLFGNRAKAMAISPDGSEVYLAFQESGNASTIIAPEISDFQQFTKPFATDMPGAPHYGQNPSPNSGTNFYPALNPNVTNLPARVGIIVRKQDGRWMDDNDGDWTEFVSGTNAPKTGRVVGWDVADNDIAVIKTGDRSVRYIRGLMNICFDLSVNPGSGRIALIGTDAINEIRFEPVLKAIFVRSKLALVDAATSIGAVSDLNPHLNYQSRSIPLAQRRLSIADPRGVAWNGNGTRAYVTGMGSGNMLMLDQEGTRLVTVTNLPDGPTGLVVDDQRNHVYVFARFASEIVTLDANSLEILDRKPLFDPTPDPIRKGRVHFYNATKNSGLGQASCASCHVDGRADRLAWDLGDPSAELIPLKILNFERAVATNDFHPMKGPMLTQTLQDMVNHEPLHWRGDRPEITAFNPTFQDLLGADNQLTDLEMQEFRGFLETIAFPPNPFRNLDNSFSESFALPFEKWPGRLNPGEPMPAGNARKGMERFRDSSCSTCHTFPTGLGPDARLTTNLVWEDIPLGEKGEHHVKVFFEKFSGEPFPLKIPQLRSLPDRMGFDLIGPVSRAGFGFLHDGRADTISRLLVARFGFGQFRDQMSDMAAFLMSYSGSDLEPSDRSLGNPPGLPSLDAPAALGRQFISTDGVLTPDLASMISHAQSATSRVDLIVQTYQGLTPRAWLMKESQFISDQAGKTNELSTLLDSAGVDFPLVFTFVSKGSGTRLALDRDGDTFLNFDELKNGANAGNPAETPETPGPRVGRIEIAEGKAAIRWFGKIGATYKIQVRTDLSPETPWIDQGAPQTLITNPTEHTEDLKQGTALRFFRIIHVE